MNTTNQSEHNYLNQQRKTKKEGQCVTNVHLYIRTLTFFTPLPGSR